MLLPLLLDCKDVSGSNTRVRSKAGKIRYRSTEPWPAVINENQQSKPKRNETKHFVQIKRTKSKRQRWQLQNNTQTGTRTADLHCIGVVVFAVNNNRLRERHVEITVTITRHSNTVAHTNKEVNEWKVVITTMIVTILTTTATVAVPVSSVVILVHTHGLFATTASHLDVKTERIFLRGKRPVSNLQSIKHVRLRQTNGHKNFKLCNGYLRKLSTSGNHVWLPLSHCRCQPLLFRWKDRPLYTLLWDCVNEQKIKQKPSYARLLSSRFSFLSLALLSLLSPSLSYPTERKLFAQQLAHQQLWDLHWHIYQSQQQQTNHFWVHLM